MKKICQILAFAVVCMFFVQASAVSAAKPLVGVKKGDWIEYSMQINGPEVDAARNITWYRCDVLDVEGGWLLVNKTALMINGTLQSSVWNFNLSAGQVFGWVIVPANLGEGESFFDAFKGANIMVEGEEQKMVLGAARTVTHGSIPGMVEKEWDKTTGVYIHACEHTTNYTIITDAVATNLWSPQPPKENWAALYQWAAAATLLAITVLSAAVLVSEKKAVQKK
jgi:hypothetical protein